MPDPIAVGPGSLDEVWCQMVQNAVDAVGGELGPASMSLDAGGVAAVNTMTPVRSAVDAALDAAGKARVATVANTIFPDGIWQRSGTRADLYERYRRAFDRRLRTSNPYGTYFLRLIDHPEHGNQLEWLFGALGKVARPLSLAVTAQADLNYQRRRGFPCLGMVGVRSVGGAVSVHGHYTHQNLFERGYGNLLGLARLAHFIAAEANLGIRSVSCSAQTLVLDMSKARARDMLSGMPPM